MIEEAHATSTNPLDDSSAHRQPVASCDKGLPNPRRPKPGTYRPKPETAALLKVSGNPINGLGETTPRRASPFFWHSPDQHPYGPLEDVARLNSRKCPGSGPAFMAAYNHPELVPVAEVKNAALPAQLTSELTAFALAHEVGAVGIAPMDPLYVFDGYTIDDPWVIILALAPNYERLKELPSDETNGIGVTEIGSSMLAEPALPLRSPTGFAPKDITRAPTPVPRRAHCC
ncbi:hypothetical protein [Granulicella sp. 5B5]|uniref:hypothetical protein n=1 Tax=Granulicella sp. 5B5 TaxID=1617967 RepID=UPI00210453DB|nr:hypothetical protein [Granulicella sp. 5B5]